MFNWWKVFCSKRSWKQLGITDFWSCLENYLRYNDKNELEWIFSTNVVQANVMVMISNIHIHAFLLLSCVIQTSLSLQRKTVLLVVYSMRNQWIVLHNYGSVMCKSTFHANQNQYPVRRLKSKSKSNPQPSIASILKQILDLNRIQMKCGFGFAHHWYGYPIVLFPLKFILPQIFHIPFPGIDVLKQT